MVVQYCLLTQVSDPYEPTFKDPVLI